ncbi:hypothetical protein C5S31_06180 [ANME-1 cluster archaeon GoMg2]|nr:hypothetical protein [ANME-1 cluster archaeon GoMg2]
MYTTGFSDYANRKDTREDFSHNESLLDFWVAGAEILGIKAVKAPIHEAQLKSYLKATKCNVDLLLTFADKSLRYKMELR